MSMDRTFKLNLVSHTHWDREWYLSFQQFRIKLVEVIDEVLELLDAGSDFNYFMLDGQTVVLEDYLEIKPQQRERLAKYIREGRLQVGPWYVSPDFFLTSGESTVRNLMLGHRISQEFGATMKVGYLPDVFGHISQMPQILRGFGIDSAVIYRGVGAEAVKTEFYWEASDGSKVLAIYLPDGYCHAANLPSIPETAREKLQSLMDRLAPMASTRNLLILNGCDHLRPQRDLPRIIKAVNHNLSNAELVHTTLARHIEAVKVEKPSLFVLKGEFRENRPARITPGVLSTRIYLKQANHAATVALENYAEPLCAISYWLGDVYPSEFLGQAWRYLLQCHPHDSICGCSIDDVHRDMLRRFAWSQEISQGMTQQALVSLTRQVDTSSIEDGIPLLVFNPLCVQRTDVAHASLTFVPDEGKEWTFADASAGNPFPFQIVKREKIQVSFDPSQGRIVKAAGFVSQEGFGRELLARLNAEAKAQKVGAERWEVLFLARNVPPLGYRTYVFRPTVVARRKGVQHLKAGDSFIENEFLRVELASNGTLTVEIKETGERYEGLHYFEDRGDAGDEYNFSPPLRDSVLTTLTEKPRVSLEERGPSRATLKIEYAWRIPQSLSENRQSRSHEHIEYPVTSFVSVYPHVRRIDIRTEVDNRAKDHRLRVGFATNIRASHSFAEMPFDVVKRKVELSEENMLPQKPTVLKGGEEVKVAAYPQRTFVSISESRRGLTVVNQGLPEYEVFPTEKGTTVFITLLRGVGWLSREDLLARSGNAGPSLPTPDAQCLGRHTFHYGFVPHRGSWEKAESYLQADEFNLPLLVQEMDRQHGVLPLSQSFVSLQPSELVLTALKEAEAGDDLVLRFYNIAEKEIQGRVRFFRPVEEAAFVNLYEEPLDEHPLKPEANGEILMTVPGRKVVTVRCKLKQPYTDISTPYLRKMNHKVRNT